MTPANSMQQQVPACFDSTLGAPTAHGMVPSWHDTAAAMTCHAETAYLWR
jgi:hypothetical protein